MDSEERYPDRHEREMTNLAKRRQPKSTDSRQELNICEANCHGPDTLGPSCDVTRGACGTVAGAVAGCSRDFLRAHSTGLAR